MKSSMNKSKSVSGKKGSNVHIKNTTTNTTTASTASGNVRDKPFVVRIRSRVGTWRLHFPDVRSPNELTIADVMKAIEETYRIPQQEQRICLKPDLKEEWVDYDSKLEDLGLGQGAMLYLDFDDANAFASSSGAGSSSSSSSSSGSSSGSGEAAAAAAVAAKKKSVDAHGNVIASGKNPMEDEAFRPGLTSLRAQKMHWTLTDMTELDDQYTFNIKAQKEKYAAFASLDTQLCNNFQEYVRKYDFKQPRCAYLYGRFVDTEEEEKKEKEKEAKAEAQAQTEEQKKSRSYGSTKQKMSLKDLSFEQDMKPKQGVVVDAMYEPAQTIREDNGEFELLEDERESLVETVANSLGLRKVGFMFSHRLRENATYNFSAHEIIESGIQCLEATEGAKDSPFVIVKLSPDENNMAQFDAFQLTPTCLDMVAHEALEEFPSKPGVSAVHKTYTAVVEAKAAEVVDNDMLIMRVPIKQHESPLKNSFPKYNRVTEEPSSLALVSVLGSTSADTLEFTRKLADFQLLMFIGEKLDQSSLNDIAQYVAAEVYPKEQEKRTQRERAKGNVSTGAKLGSASASAATSASASSYSNNNNSKNSGSGGAGSGTGDDMVNGGLENDHSNILPEGYSLMIKEVAGVEN